MKTKVVVFNNHGLGARVLVNPDVVPIGAFVNPDLKLVEGFSPSYWKLENGSIIPMTSEERAEVDKLAGTISYMTTEQGVYDLKQIWKEFKKYELENEFVHKFMEAAEKKAAYFSAAIDTIKKYEQANAVNVARRIGELENKIRIYGYVVVSGTFLILVMQGVLAWLLK